MSNSLERRKQLRPELAQLDRRGWNIVILSCGISIFLAIGIALFCYPALEWRAYSLDPHLVRILPQLIIGLLMLVFLETIYLVAKQRELSELRNYILGICMEDHLAEPDCPRDSLTGVFNRRALPDILKRETAWVDRYNVSLCLVIFDIGGFAKINETQGNLAGDLVLKDLACLLQVTVRRTDSVLRYGSDQFLCFLPRTDLAGGEAFAKRVEKALQCSARLRDLIVHFGMAVYEATMDPNEVLADAEKGLAARRKRVSSPDGMLVRSNLQPS